MGYRKVYEPKNDEYNAEARERLTEMFPKGSKVHTVVKHVTSSGMGRTIAVLAINGDEIYDVSYSVARVLGWKIDDRGGVYVQGCGTDMCFHLVYTLAQKLYNDGYALTARGI